MIIVQIIVLQLIPLGQTIDNTDMNYTGLLRFRFWQFGRWKEVLIDDWLPTKDGKNPLYGRNIHQDEFWLALLEKAYAKYVIFLSKFLVDEHKC